MTLEWVGWLATAVFASSYLSKNANILRCIQAGAALLWMVYGAVNHVMPVVVANAVVAVVAVSSSVMRRKDSTAAPGQMG